MVSRVTQGVAQVYAERHEIRRNVFGEKPYSNYGYWPREGMTIEEAGDALTDLVAGAAGIGPGDRVLEVGCGYGAGAVYYTRRYRPDFVVGIDATEVRMWEARKYIARNGLADTIRVGLADATALPFARGSFTRVIAIECAFHFHTRRDFFREVARILVPGGVLVLTDTMPGRGVVRDTYLERIRSLARSDGRPHVAENVCDAETYVAHLRAAGFDDVRLDIITDRTVPRFADYLERLSRQADGERGKALLTRARLYRDYLDAGMEYILVSARRVGG